jgi:hypothetical protein
VSDVAQPSDGPFELPSDYRAFRRSYRWLLLYGPWALAVLGVVLIGVGLFANRPGEVALAAIGFGAAMFIAGVLLPRMRGPLELGPSGVKGAVEGLPEALMLVAVTAKEAAEQAIPADDPNKERRVDQVVGHTVSEMASSFALEPRVIRTVPFRIPTLEDERRRREVIRDAIRWLEAYEAHRKEHGEPPDDQER